MSRHNWTQEDTYALIEEYQNNSVLWNIKSPGYRNRELKKKVLSKIAGKFNCNEREIQRKLHNLRNQVSQELNKMKKKRGNSKDEVHSSNWPYFTSLQFLIPGLISRSITLKNEDEEEEDTHSDLNNEEMQKTDEQMQRTNPKERVEKKSLKRKDDSDDDSFKVLKRAMEIIQKEPDENDRFGEYVAMELRSLRFDYNRRRLKSEIRKAIVRIVDEDDTSYSSTSAVPSS